MKKVELLFPAGDNEKLTVGFHFGGDAVYIGLKNFSLRANAKNFGDDSVIEMVNYTHSIGKKIYIALNVYILPSETELLIEKLKFIETVKPDGIIISDLGVLYLARIHAPSVAIHISTQANTTNQYAVSMYKELGVKRIVLARELELTDIRKIRESVNDIELETFVHGAMCIAYSGRCILSAYMTKDGLGRRDKDTNIPIRSANRGDCSHTCRWEYTLKEKTRPNQEFDTYQNEDGTYILSSKDICMVYNLKDLIEAGIDSFKIEGRMKSVLYISSIVRAYRNAIDNYYDHTVQFNREFVEKELNVVSHREFSTGFFYTSAKLDSNVAKSAEYEREMRLAALVTEIKNDRVVLKVYNKITKNDKLEYISNNMTTYKVKNIYFFNKDGNEVDEANHSKYVEATIYNDTDSIIEYKINDILRMECDF